MLAAVVKTGGEALACRGAVERLEIEMVKCQRTEPRRIDAGLRMHQFKFITTEEPEFSAAFRANADPVQSWRCRQGAVGLYSNLEPLGFQCRYQFSVEL